VVGTVSIGSFEVSRSAALATFEEVLEAVEFGIGQRFVLGEGLQRDTQTLSAIALRYYPSLPVALSDWRAATKVGARVAADTGGVHTPTMTLKNAELLALIGMILMTALLVWTFVVTFLNVAAGLGSCCDAVPVIHLCLWLLQRGCTLLRVPSSAVVVIVACPLPHRLASSPEYRFCGRSLWTAMPKAFFCPMSTTSFLPRVIPV
jgi:hypothetical protein